MGYLAIILATIGLVAIIAALFIGRPREGDDQYDKRAKQQSRGAAIITSVVAFVLAGISLFIAMFTVIDAGEVGVEVLWGEVRSVRSEGVNFVNPFSGVVRYPVRLVESTYTDTVDEGEKAGADAIQAFSAENAAVFVDLTVLWSIDPAKADVVYKTVKDQYRETLVRPITRSATRDCVALFDFDVARTTARAQVSQCIVDEMTSQLSNKGIIVESVQLRGMTADAALQQSIEDKLKAANLVKEAEFKRDQAAVDAEKRIIQAEAEKQAAIIAAEGRAESAIIAAEANAQKIEIESEAQAEANILIDASLNPPILSLLQVEALAAGGNLVIMDGNGVTPLLNVGG